MGNAHASAVMKNIPREYTREDLLELIDAQGFEGTYAFVYLPWVFRAGLNAGYAFISFTTRENFERFQEHFSGFTHWKVSSDRICHVSLNDKCATVDESIALYRNSPLMHESVED